MNKYILFSLFAVISSCVSAQFTVMTYNIRNSNANDGVNNWENRRVRLVQLIQKVNPDVLGTQEVLFDQLKYLNKSLKEYNSYGVGRNNGKHAGEHSAIYYRKDKYELLQGGNFWLSETPAVPGSKSWDAAITRICSWVTLRDRNTGVELFVFNTHFDHKGKEARRKSAELVMRMIDSLAAGLPVVLMGDFNFTPQDTAYETLTGTGVLSDSFRDGTVNETACGFSVSNTECSRIDYIFYSKAFAVQSYIIHTDNNGEYYPSDHLAVSAVLEKR